MITISCSLLEQVRKNPTGFAEFIAIGEKSGKGGTHGMFACWQDVARQIHAGELILPEGVKKLQSLFNRFDHTARNLARQADLIDKLEAYIGFYEKMAFNPFDNRRRIQWPLTKDIKLTGLTPPAYSRSNEYFAYFCVEKKFPGKPNLSTRFSNDTCPKTTLIAI